MKAGQKRALDYFAEHFVEHHYRCPECLSDLRRPKVVPEGIRCLYCVNLDTRRKIVIRKQPVRGGFRWVAEFEK
jgi:hypothetical protein